MDSIFTKIIKGELAASFVYEDEQCVAFMDLHPFNEGHVLIVPREEKARIADLSDDVAGHIFMVGQKIIRAMNKTSSQPDGYNLFLSDGEVAGQEVPHCHLHILPRQTDDGIKVSFGLSPKKESREQLDKVAEKIKSCL